MLKEEMEEPDLDKAPPTPTIPSMNDPPVTKIAIKDEPDDSFNLEVDIPNDDMRQEDDEDDDYEESKLQIKEEEDSDDDVPLVS